ncbi:MAG: hypothetical protein LBD67_05700 [Candidatus Accumulibacter sp.]|jgi:hypothetical protein|nr:hypothetical protein [Accumulibacter sp.]
MISLRNTLSATFLSTALVLSAPASAACTPEQAQQKAMALSTQLQAVAQKDAAKFQKLSQELAQESTKLQQAGNTDAVCKYYDDMLAKTKSK